MLRSQGKDLKVFAFFLVFGVDKLMKLLYYGFIE